MVDNVRIGPVAVAAGGQNGHTPRRQAPPRFQQVLAGAIKGATAPHVVARPSVQPAVARVPSPAVGSDRTAGIPAQSDAALTQAMALEGVPQVWQSDLRFIMAQESGGRVDAKNPVHSARGLFQLTAAHYHLNPNGARSFGNAVEEAQGGIRYIQQRYGSADKAVAFWRQHRWY